MRDLWIIARGKRNEHDLFDFARYLPGKVTDLQMEKTVKVMNVLGIKPNIIEVGAFYESDLMGGLQQLLENGKIVYAPKVTYDIRNLNSALSPPDFLLTWSGPDLDLKSIPDFFAVPESKASQLPPITIWSKKYRNRNGRGVGDEELEFVMEADELLSGPVLERTLGLYNVLGGDSGMILMESTLHQNVGWPERTDADNVRKLYLVLPNTRVQLSHSYNQLSVEGQENPEFVLRQNREVLDINPEALVKIITKPLVSL